MELLQREVDRESKLRVPGWLRDILYVKHIPAQTTEASQKGIKTPSALQTDLLHDALLIIVAKGSAQLVVVHGRTVLLDPPQPGHLQNKALKRMNVCEPNPGAKEHHPADSLLRNGTAKHKTT